MSCCSYSVLLVLYSADVPAEGSLNSLPSAIRGRCKQAKMDDLSKQDEIQSSAERIWALLDQVMETEDDNISLTKMFWRKNGNKDWDFIKLSQFGSTFHKTFGKVAGQFKIIGQEFRDNDLAFHHWRKQNNKVDKTYISEWKFSRVAGRIFAENENNLLEKFAAITGCFLTTIINEGFANFDDDLMDNYTGDIPENGYDFQLWTCDRKMLVSRLEEIKKLLPVGFKLYNTDDFGKYIKRNKKEPRVIFEK